MNKKLILTSMLLTGLVLSNPLMSQIKKLKTVRNDMTRDIDKDIAKSKYDIDQVMTNSETSNLAAAWGWNGVIYCEIAMLNDTSSLKKELDPNNKSALTSAESLAKFYTYSDADQSEYDAKDYVKYYLPNTIILAYSAGEDAIINKRGFKEVKTYMDLVVTLMPYDVDQVAKGSGITVEKAYYNIWRAAYLDSMVDDEIVYLEKLAAVPNYLNSDVYIRLSQIYSDRKDYDKALSYLEAGRTKIPQKSTEFLEQQINIELSRNNHESILNKFNEVIKNDPTNSNYYFSRGVTYHQLKTKELEAQEKQYKAGEAVTPSKYSFSMAMSDYTKALELDPSNFDTRNNIAVLLFDSANYVYKQMTRVAGAYDRLKSQATNLFSQAYAKFDEIKQSGYLKDEEYINLLLDMKTCASKTNDIEKKKELEKLILAEKKRLQSKG